MKPNLCFLGGCEFDYIIHELKSDPEQYFDFDYFYSFEHRGQTDPYTYLIENSHEILQSNFDAIIISQHDAMMEPIKQIQLNRVTSRQKQDQQLKDLVSQCELMIITLSRLKCPDPRSVFPVVQNKHAQSFQATLAAFERRAVYEAIHNRDGRACRRGIRIFMYLTCRTSVQCTASNKHSSRQMRHGIAISIFPQNTCAKNLHIILSYVIRRKKKIKCVLVDLDNTMWNGIIRNVGIENVQIRIDKERFRWNVLCDTSCEGNFSR